MKKENISILTAQAVKGILNIVLRLDANSASSGFAHQPKAPASLSRFRREK